MKTACAASLRIPSIFEKAIAGSTDYADLLDFAERPN